ncbi:heterokaryon incompatibility protein-domain-containing protein [Cadophora sp. MPI-SDFR-AT-0126]|nr:heterokaryon incompatibility protein-domain-containing protein [Leotiomycetes sp. MPI-SDFR-AT-0126]
MSSSSYLPEIRDGEIRLLYIAPGDFTAPIICTLKVRSISSKPAYEALSYTWNSTGGLQTITVNGFPCSVTSNLQLALRHLRPRSGEEAQGLVLWVDALCIDQSNDEEKAVQVGMMGNIYRGARRVRAWIGERDEEDEDADEAGQEEIGNSWTVWRLLEDFGSSKRFDSWDTEHPYILKPGQGLNEMLKCLTDCWETESGKQSWKIMTRMLNRPYWTRVWIQQELYSNRHVIVHCGSKSAAFECWTRALEAHSYESDLDLSDRSIKLQFGNVRPCSQEVGYAGSIVLLFGLGRRYHKRVNGHESHVRLLRQQLFRGATDPRDKIYGILDMVECWAEGRFRADYTVSTSQVYVRAVQSTIKRWKSLDVLLDMMPCPVSMRMFDLPTWCPDWSHFITLFEDGSEVGDLKSSDVPRGLNRRADVNKFDYSRNSISHTEISDDGRVLHCYGIMLDYLCEVVEGPWTSAQEESSYENVARLLRLTNAEHYPGRKEALWRTLISNRASKMDLDPQTFVPAPDDFGGRFETWLQIQRLWQELNQNPEDESLQSLKTNSNALAKALMPIDKQLGTDVTSVEAMKQVDTWYLPFVVSCQLASRQRRFFMTKGDHMGLAPMHTLPGDVIVVLYGASLPVILRPVGTHFEFIGEAYVNMWERGEAVDLAEKGELEKRWFELH